MEAPPPSVPLSRWTRTWRRARSVIYHRGWIVLVTVLLSCSAGGAAFLLAPKEYRARVRLEAQGGPTSSPENAADDARRDIEVGLIHYYMVGGFAPSAPGVPEQIQAQYPYMVAGTGLGCSGTSPEESEYARRYNEAVVAYLSQ